jgi:phosphatidylserine decarboxylase
MAYKIAPNGDCEFYFLSPDDAHHFKPCTWTIGDDKLILQISASGKSISYQIDQLTSKSLRLTPLEPSQKK